MSTTIDCRYLYGESYHKGVGKIVNNETFLKTAVEIKEYVEKEREQFLRNMVNQ